MEFSWAGVKNTTFRQRVVLTNASLEIFDVPTSEGKTSRCLCHYLASQRDEKAIAEVPKKKINPYIKKVSSMEKLDTAVLGLYRKS